MNSENTPVKRKTGGLIAKNLIILFVLVAVCAFSIWAWFTKNTKATADGISVIAKGEGVEVSWDGNDYYYDLTALTAEEMAEDTTGRTGMAKFITDNGASDGNPYGLKLITGNGNKFFEPYLNRRTGEVFLDDGAWEGVEITDANSSGRYIDVDLYFQSTVERTVWLAGNSRVLPKDLSDTDRYSDYGSFSRDYIAGASRVAFLEYDRTVDEITGEVTETLGDCSFIWAPNADYKLSEGDGYKKHTDEEEDVSGGGTTSDLDGGAVEVPNTSYYLWTIDATANYAGGDQRKITNSYEFEYDASIRYYVATFTVIVPSYKSENPSIPFLISTSADSPLENTFTIDRSTSFNGNEEESLLKISDQTYNAATFNNVSIPVESCSQFYITKTNTLVQGDAVVVEFGFNPQTNVVTVLGYKGNDSWSKGDEITEDPVVVKYYELENTETNCALVNPAGAVAVSTSEHSMKAVYFNDTGSVKPVSITTAEQFTATKTGTGLDATYTFYNSSSGKYLSISSGSLTLTTTSSNFTLEYVEGLEGPVLKSGEYCLVYQDGKMQAVKFDELTDLTTVVTIYEGTSYTCGSGLDAESSYVYYDKDDKTTNALSASSTPPLYTSTSTTAEATIIGDLPIATLKKVNDTDDYYTAHIVIRIWVEGTDREAKTPLADGIFNLDLHFTSNPQVDNTTTE